MCTDSNAIGKPPAEQSGQHWPGIRIGCAQVSRHSVLLQTIEPSAWNRRDNENKEQIFSQIIRGNGQDLETETQTTV